MGRRIEPTEPGCGGTMTQNSSGHAIRSLPASEQLSTRSCARCAGLLVNEWYYDLDNTGEYNTETFRCVQCGHRVDPVILQTKSCHRSKANQYGRRGQGTPQGQAY